MSQLVTDLLSWPHMDRIGIVAIYAVPLLLLFLARHRRKVPLDHLAELESQ